MRQYSASSKRIAASALLLIGAVIVGLQLQKEIVYRTIASRGIAVSGVVVEEIRHSGSRQRGRSWTEANVTYVVGGMSFTELVREGRPYRVGETIELRYLPEDPSVIVDAEVLRDMSAWRSYMQRFGLATFFILGGLFIFIKTRRQE